MSHRTGFLFIWLSTFGLLGFGFFLEHYLHLTPCPLCMSQRLCFAVLFTLAFIGYLFAKPQGFYKKTYFLIFLFSCFGAALASRQIWLQHLPKDQIPACGPDLFYLIEEFPLSDVISALLTGDGNCAEEIWSFLGLNIAEWSLLWFCAFTLLTLTQWLRRAPMRDSEWK